MNPKWKVKKGIQNVPVEKSTRKRDPSSSPKHLRHLRSLPCAVGTYPIEGATPCAGKVQAHHPTGSGLALTASDREAFPLCRRHHTEELHLLKGSFYGWTKEELREWQRQMSGRYAP